MVVLGLALTDRVSIRFYRGSRDTGSGIVPLKQLVHHSMANVNLTTSSFPNYTLLKGADTCGTRFQSEVPSQLIGGVAVILDHHSSQFVVCSIKGLPTSVVNIVLTAEVRLIPVLLHIMYLSSRLTL